MEEIGTSRESACLQVLRGGIANPAAADLEGLLKGIQAEDLAEEASELTRSVGRDIGDRSLIETLSRLLAPLAAKARQRRAALWHLDTRRVLSRFTYIKEGEAVEFDDGDLHALFLHAFRLEGLRLVLDLGKRPRPLLTLGLPLPAGIGSRCESMDAVLVREPEGEPGDLMTRLNRRIPHGLRIIQWSPLPGYASTVADLARLSHWCWEAGPELRPQLEDRVTTFLRAGEWPWERGPAKSETTMDLRIIIPSMLWKHDALWFATRMGAFQAINPLKMLKAIFGLDPARIGRVFRAGVDLDADPRLGQGERFEPKLKNMYEDAVLLGGGSNIVLVDEEDDEPLRLG